MRSASGKKASRVCMGLLPQRACFLARSGDGLTDKSGSCPPRQVVNCKHVVQLHEFVEGAVEVRINALQFLEQELLQFAMFVLRGANLLSNLPVSDTDRHAFRDMIRVGGTTDPASKL